MANDGGLHSSHTHYDITEDRTAERKKALDVLSGKEKTDQLIEALNNLFTHQQEMEKGLSDQQMQQAISLYQTRYQHYVEQREREEAEAEKRNGKGLIHKLFQAEEAEELDPTTEAFKEMQQFIQSIRASSQDEMRQRREQIAAKIDELLSAIQVDHMSEPQKEALHSVLNHANGGDEEPEEYLDVDQGLPGPSGAG